jgi:hypothetical protein
MSADELFSQATGIPSARNCRNNSFLYLLPSFVVTQAAWINQG